MSTLTATERKVGKAIFSFFRSCFGNEYINNLSKYPNMRIRRKAVVEDAMRETKLTEKTVTRAVNVLIKHSVLEQKDGFLFFRDKKLLE
jgi:hypothetical protein